MIFWNTCRTKKREAATNNQYEIVLYRSKPTTPRWGNMGVCGGGPERASPDPLQTDDPVRNAVPASVGDLPSSIRSACPHDPELEKIAGATEALKAADLMKWVGLMNACKAQAEENILTELVYT